jgi:hypothetical protein
MFTEKYTEVEDPHEPAAIGDEEAAQETQRKEQEHDSGNFRNAPGDEEHGDTVNAELLEREQDLVRSTSLKTGRK